MKKWECTVCGYIHTGEEPPDECPVCSADKSLFIEVIEHTAPDGATTEQVASSSPPGGATVLHKAHSLASEVIVRHHLHPIMVHTPNGILPMALIFLLIATFFGMPLFESAAFYSLVFVLLSMPLVVFTGYEVWQKRYRGARTPTFTIKIGAAVVTVVLLATLIIWRVVQPDIVATASNGRWIFLGLAVLLVGTVGIAGHIGGKLVFAHRKN